MVKKTKTVYFENLNALRGIAFIIVFLYHFFGYMSNGSKNGMVTSLIMKGHLGVNLFFVLSGFLITYLLLTEKEETGKINILFFYMRRVLRIWPLYILVLIMGFFVYPLITHEFHISTLKDHLAYYIGFLGNFDRIRSGFVGIGNDNLGVLWSVAVEEQFYLFWPVILSIVNKKWYLPLFIGIIFSSLLFRFLYQNNEAVLYLHTFSVMSDLATGSLLAYAAIFKTSLFFKLQSCKRIFIYGVYIILFLLIFFYEVWAPLNAFTIVTERFILSLCFVFIIGEQCFACDSFLKLGKIKLLSGIGIISYGLYCLHLYSIVIVQKLNSMLHYKQSSPIVFFAELIVCFGISILMCMISYRYFEKKILQLKNKYVTVYTL